MNTTSKRLHPFQRLYSSKRGGYTKPHVFRVAGQWHTVAVPSDTFVLLCHSDTGDWVRECLPSTPGDVITTEGDAPLAFAIARRAARHHG